MLAQRTAGCSRGLPPHKDARLLEDGHLDQGKALKGFSVVNKAKSCLEAVFLTCPEILIVGPDQWVRRSFLTDTAED